MTFMSSIFVHRYCTCLLMTVTGDNHRDTASYPLVGMVAVAMTKMAALLREGSVS